MQLHLTASFVTSRYGAAASAKLARDMGLNSVGLLIEDNAYGQGVLMLLVDACVLMQSIYNKHTSAALSGSKDIHQRVFTLDARMCWLAQFMSDCRHDVCTVCCFM
jgi:hypothetical protein